MGSASGSGILDAEHVTHRSVSPGHVGAEEGGLVAERDGWPDRTTERRVEGTTAFFGTTGDSNG